MQVSKVQPNDGLGGGKLKKIERLAPEVIDDALGCMLPWECVQVDLLISKEPKVA